MLGRNVVFFYRSSEYGMGNTLLGGRQRSSNGQGGVDALKMCGFFVKRSYFNILVYFSKLCLLLFHSAAAVALLFSQGNENGSLFFTPGVNNSLSFLMALMFN